MKIIQINFRDVNYGIVNIFFVMYYLIIKNISLGGEEIE